MDSAKFIMWTCVTIGGVFGTYIPVWIFRVDPLSGWSVIGSVVGGIVSIWVWYRYIR